MTDIRLLVIVSKKLADRAYDKNTCQQTIENGRIRYSIMSNRINGAAKFIMYVCSPELSLGKISSKVFSIFIYVSFTSTVTSCKRFIPIMIPSKSNKRK